MKGFIEVTTLATVTQFDKGYEVQRIIHEVELISLNNIASVSNTGNIILMRGYPNGDHVCRTNHTYEEIKQLIKEATELKGKRPTELGFEDLKSEQSKVFKCPNCGNDWDIEKVNS